MRLTEKNIQRIEAPSKRIQIKAGESLYLRVQPSGHKSWVLRIARNLIKQIPADGGEPMLSPVDAATNKLFGALGISFEKL